MTLQDVYSLLLSSGYPVAYRDYTGQVKKDIPNPPFMVYSVLDTGFDGGDMRKFIREQDINVELYNTSSNAPAAHAEGYSSIAAGQAAHAEGQGTQAAGNNSHSGGYGASSFNNSSFSHGIYTVANKDAEIAVGKYNKSSSDTLFSVGDGTADDARHNSFEITTTGGKLHDKDIAVIDDIPSELPANGGNADTVCKYKIMTDVITINSDSGGYVWLPGKNRIYISTIIEGHGCTIYIDAVANNTNLYVPDAKSKTLTIHTAWLET